ncbi:MAG: NAD(+)/NADH kinase [Nitrospirota bacterium]|jgi:NAD+ kinase
MKRIGIICKPDAPEPPGLLKDLVPWLLERKFEVYLEKEVAAFKDAKSVPRSEFPGVVDMVVVLGGDGTMLGTARLVAPRGIPVLGVNLGGLGFITEIYTDELLPAMEKIIKGECPTEERMMLAARITREGEEISRYTALNDIVINKGAVARIIDLEVRVNKTYVTLFKSDGAIVATPTGSTAYSLSAGGPILYPTLHALVLTPISPHTLTNRPVVLQDDAKIELTLKSRSDGVLLSLDGQVGYTLRGGDTVEVEKSPHVATLFRAGGRDHFDILRTKLKWGER